MSEGVVGDISIAERNLFGNGQCAASQACRQPDAAAGRGRLHGAALPRHQHGRRLRPLLQGRRLHHPGLLHEPEDRRRHARCAIPSTTNGRSASTTRSSATRSTTSARTPPLAIKEAVPGWPDATSTTYYTSSVGYSLPYDTRDNKKRPSSGVYYTVAQDLAGVGGDVRYIRSVGEVRAYYPVTERSRPSAARPAASSRGWGGQDVRLLDLFYKGSETCAASPPPASARATC